MVQAKFHPQIIKTFGRIGNLASSFINVHGRAAFAERRFDIPGELSLVHVRTIRESQLVVLVMAVSIDNLRVGKQKETLLASLDLVVRFHLRKYALGVGYRDIVRIEVTTFRPVVVDFGRIGRSAVVKVAQMDCKYGV